MASGQSRIVLHPARPAFTLIELMIVVAIMGVLAAIAIPSFTKSVRRARTSEAMIGLRKIFDGSVVYFDRDHTNARGGIVPAQFPATADWAPQATPPAGTKAEPDMTAWAEATWEALDFAVSDPYYYVYAYRSAGTTDGARFEGFAAGDLDGDRVFSTFIRGGTAGAGGVRGFAGVARISPLE